MRVSEQAPRLGTQKCTLTNSPFFPLLLLTSLLFLFLFLPPSLLPPILLPPLLLTGNEMPTMPAQVIP